ncbi:MAG: hypothetical protein ABSE25_07840 [Syntrophorhabdales bacterium]|jgi:hypothetical protein
MVLGITLLVLNFMCGIVNLLITVALWKKRGKLRYASFSGAVVGFAAMTGIGYRICQVLLMAFTGSMGTMSVFTYFMHL